MCFTCDPMFLGKLEGQLRCGPRTATITATMCWIWSTIQQLRKGQFRSIRFGNVDLRMHLQSPGGRHCPTGTASSLYSREATGRQLTPIPGLCNGIHLQKRWFCTKSTHDGIISLWFEFGTARPIPKHGAVFRVRHVGKFVHFCPPSLFGLCILSINLGFSLNEKGQSLLVIRWAMLLTSSILVAKSFISLDVFCRSCLTTKWLGSKQCYD